MNLANLDPAGYMGNRVRVGFNVLDITEQLRGRPGAAGPARSARAGRARPADLQEVRPPAALDTGAVGGAVALGTNDGICFPTPALDPDTGELLDLHWSRRLQRWELQAAARDLLPESRLRVCYRHRQKQTDFVRVYRRGEAEAVSTYYRGLQVCGSVWCCPVCAAKITERKRRELVGALQAHRATGGGVMLLTLTVPHSREDEPFELVGKLLDSFRKFGQGRSAWSALVPGYVGSVRALEVTHGANGWHPHLHVLVFTDAGLLDAERAELADLLFGRWAAVTKRAGLGDVHPEHGLRLDDGSVAGSYVSKGWGFAEELTKANVKTGRREGSRSPWELLADFATGDRAAGELFRQFAGAFKGKSQLHWSRGLRARFGLDAEKSDEQLAAETVEAEDVLAARIRPDDWKLIRRHELRGLVLEMLKGSDWSAVAAMLDQFKGDKDDGTGVSGTQGRSAPEAGSERIRVDTSLRAGTRLHSSGDRGAGRDLSCGTATSPGSRASSSPGVKARSAVP